MPSPQIMIKYITFSLFIGYISWLIGMIITSLLSKSEFNHNFAFQFMGIFILIKVFQGFYIFAIVMLLVNILINLYPILLQQQNKRRIDRYLQLMNQRSLQNLTR